MTFVITVCDNRVGFPSGEEHPPPGLPPHHSVFGRPLPPVHPTEAERDAAGYPGHSHTQRRGQDEGLVPKRELALPSFFSGESFVILIKLFGEECRGRPVIFLYMTRVCNQLSIS